MHTLRHYQQEAREAVWDYVRRKVGNPCVVIPTGGGKSLLLAALCMDIVGWGGRVLCLAHVKELLEQSFGELKELCDVPVGLYSAGLGRRETEQAILIAGIQSAYNKADILGAFDVVIVDECHLIPSDGDGMYLKLIRDSKEASPHLRVIGLTATPYRLDSGFICGPDCVLTEICYEAEIAPLIREGFLCPLVSNRGVTQPMLESVHSRGGDYVMGELESVCNEKTVVQAACEEIEAATSDRHSILVFTAGIRHAIHVTETLKSRNLDAEYLTGDTKPKDRERLIAEFKAGSLRFLVNVNVLTTGFNAPNVDCVVLLRPTQSCGLYYQMVGRGFRRHASKANTLVLDFGGNIERHGPVDDLKAKRKGAGTGDAVVKLCPKCGKEVPGGVRFCLCGFVFPLNSAPPHETTAATGGILKGQVSREEHAVIDTSYRVHFKKGDSAAPPTLRVDYHTTFTTWISEWVCLEHEGFARQKAVQWWVKRSGNPVPRTVEDALKIISAGGLAETEKITVKKVAGERYDRVEGYSLGPIPPRVEVNIREPGEDEDDYFATEAQATDRAAEFKMSEEDVPF